MNVGELVMTSWFENGNLIGYQVERADDVIMTTVEVITELPVRDGCITFVALNGTFTYRFAGVQPPHGLVFERVREETGHAPARK